MNTPLLPAHDTEAKPRRAVLLGVGNILLSDEGVGVRLVERILDRHRLPAGVAVLDGGTCAMEMLEDLEHLDLLVIADCVRSGRTPGGVVVLRDEKRCRPSSAPSSRRIRSASPTSSPPCAPLGARHGAPWWSASSRSRSPPA